MAPPLLVRAAVAALGLLLGCDGGMISDPGLEPGDDPVHTRRPPGDPLSDPGRVTLHRLNRVEYNNTVRDLLGTSQTPADDFPPDDRGYGFDNIADVLSTSPLHLEMYQAAAESLIDEALGSSSSVGEGSQQLEAETVGGSVGSVSGTAWNLFSNGEVTASVELPADGQYRVSVRAWGQQAGPDPAQMSISLGGRTLATVDVTATSDAPEVYEATTESTRGNQVVSVAFLNDYYDSAAGADRNLLVDWIRIEGPLGVMPGTTSTRARIMVCEEETDACARQILEAFTLRAWRRPASAAELDRLMSFTTLASAQGDSWEQGVRLSLQSVLVSPHFLYRVEIDPDPASTEPHPLTDFELASRLSYFLWSSMPDDELLGLAQAGMLQDADVLRAQAERMLMDPRAEALIDNFAGQWLFARKVDDHVPDYEVYPSYDAELGESMKRELELFFRDFLYEDIPVDEMLTADFTYVDARLAAHYGVTASGADFTRVTLPPERRAGLLGKGAILMVTSHATRTSPVKRGVWVLEQLLCAAPPPPPPGVEGLEDQELTAGTLRERMEMHRRDPVCASCHQLMDPIGLGLETFDGIGAYRTEDAGEPIDSSGTLPDGASFSGAVELSTILAEDPRFSRCVAKQMMTYALGRGMEHTADEAWIDEITRSYTAGGAHLRALILSIVESEPFRMRRGEEVAP